MLLFTCCNDCKELKTLFSEQYVQREYNALSAISEIKVLVSAAFLSRVGKT
jgi:hypothetical protein